jgi:hypothetical protein
LADVRDVGSLLGRGDGELAVRVPPVRSLHRSDDLAGSEGSNESKRLGEEGVESDEQQRVGRQASKESLLWARVGGLRTRLYENSLLLTMGGIFFATWLAQSLNNWHTFNQEQRDHDDEPISWGRYLVDPDFWERTLQNWQSEFLAVGTMAVFTIYLRQRGSPESKPLGAPHHETGSSG